MPAARREKRFGSKTVRDLMGRAGRRAAAARATPPPMEWPRRCRGRGAREQQEETRAEKSDRLGLLGREVSWKVSGWRETGSVVDISQQQVQA